MIILIFALALALIQHLFKYMHKKTTILNKKFRSGGHSNVILLLYYQSHLSYLRCLIM